MTTATQGRPERGGKGSRRARPELLAPAGNLDKLKFAVHYGADAVYIGGEKYGLRSNADNFSHAEMEEGVAFASRYGAKVYVTTNIYAHEDDLRGLEDELRRLARIGVAGIIAADPAVVDAARRVAPELDIHLSTQQSTLNWQAAAFWKREGVPRIVLAREATLEDIREIKARVDIEIETFIHGAMCSAISGRCVLSNHFTDRDSNRGGCCQSCRWAYDLREAGRSLVGEGDPPFAMSAKDLSMLAHLPELIEAGVDSFKIEGRMKSMHYVATVVHVYRQALDAYLADPERYRPRPEWAEELAKAENRPVSTGFYFGEPGAESHIYGTMEKPAPLDFAGVVRAYDPATGVATVEQRSPFRPGMLAEFFGPEGCKFRQTIGELADEAGRPLAAARHPLQLVRLRTAQPVRPLDMMRKVAT